MNPTENRAESSRDAETRSLANRVRRFALLLHPGIDAIAPADARILLTELQQFVSHESRTEKPSRKSLVGGLLNLGPGAFGGQAHAEALLRKLEQRAALEERAPGVPFTLEFGPEPVAPQPLSPLRCASDLDCGIGPPCAIFAFTR
jgi:hypothetical protein